MKSSLKAGLQKSYKKGLYFLARDIYRAIKKNIKLLINKNRVRSKQKIFCIGSNKTGTTSLKVLFQKLGYIVGNQRFAGRLQKYYLNRNFEPIIEYCKTAQVFQDFPFCYPKTYEHLDIAYPNSKFILSVRDDAEQWYSSITRFHSKIFGNGEIPTAEMLKNSVNTEKGWIWRNFQDVYGVDEDDPYNKDKLINSYTRYNNDVIEYFENRPNDLIVINIAKKEDFKRLIDFLNINTDLEDFPWENRT